MILYLIRHAEPEISEYAGFPGPNLGDIGKKQAQNVANFLQTKPIKRLLTSDYTRVLQTLEPYQIDAKKDAEKLPVLRERENEVETHEELVARVESWFRKFLLTETENTAIFSHCGPINMILFYLDRKQKILNYPFECEYLCLTPKGGIWVLNIENQQLKNGILIKNL